MNTLVVFESEINNNMILFEGQRALAYNESLSVNQDIRIALLGKFCARGRVIESNKTQVLIQIEDIIDTPKRLNVSLFVAVPRPQTIKKVISLAAQIGIKSLYFVKSYHTVPSYLQSKTLEQDAIQSEVIKALEQVWDCVPPKIEIIERMGIFFETTLPKWKGDNKHNLLLLAEPLSENTVSLDDLIVDPSLDLSVMLGIGPEKGWAVSEVSQFLDLGFRFVHLSEREYRVETALALFLGQLLLKLRS